MNQTWTVEIKKFNKRHYISLINESIFDRIDNNILSLLIVDALTKFNIPIQTCKFFLRTRKIKLKTYEIKFMHDGSIKCEKYPDGRYDMIFRSCVD